MKKSVQFLGIILAMIVISFISCEQNDDGKAEIHGHVEMGDSVVTGATVNLFEGDTATDPYTGFMEQSNSDALGEFEFHELAKGTYYVFAYIVEEHDTIHGSDHVQINAKSGVFEADVHFEHDDVHNDDDHSH